MRNPEFWKPILIGILVTPLIFFLGMLFSGGGHTITAMILFFPYGMLLGLVFTSTLSWWVIGVPVFALQFPLYGLAFSLATKKHNLGWLLTAIIISHFVAATLCFFFYSSSPNM